MELQKRIRHWDNERLICIQQAGNEKLQESQKKVELLQRQVEDGQQREKTLQMKIEQAKQQGREREREVIEREKDLMQQFQHFQRQLQEAQQKEKKKECEIQQGNERERQAREREKYLRQQLQSESKQRVQQLQQAREREKGLEKQLDDLQRLLQQAQQQEEESKMGIQQGFERERQGKEREQHLQQQLQEKKRELEQYRQEKEKEVQLARENLQNLQQQLQKKERESEQYRQEKETQLQQAREMEINLQLQLEQTREKEIDLQRQVEGGQKKEQDLQMQIELSKQQVEEREQNLRQQHLEKEEIQRQLEETRKSKQQLDEKAKKLEEEIFDAKSSWEVNKNEIIVTNEVLGKGGYGEVKVADFRGLKVAAKYLYEAIISPYNIEKFSHEMNIASKIRHPNLVQFIGATTEGSIIILTEIMQTSLRKKLETGGLSYPAILSISLDVAHALNYLHLFKPNPILHRDVSSANVLLQQMMGGEWRAKVSDYGTVKLQHLVTTKNPGNPVYSAPESPYPRQHSPAMDVFSYGVLLIEMNVHQFPDVDKRAAHIEDIKGQSLKNLIQRCLIENYKERPTMSGIIKEMISEVVN